MVPFCLPLKLKQNTVEKGQFFIELKVQRLKIGFHFAAFFHNESWLEKLNEMNYVFWL